MTPAEWVALVGQQGMPVCAAGVVLWAVIWSLRRSAKTQDQLLDRILHGDGNGGPSIVRLGDQLQTIGRQQGINTDAIEQLASSMGSMRAEVGDLRSDVQQLGSAWEECRATPGCPNNAEGQ